MKAFLFRFLALLLALVWSRPAHANGRYPYAQQLLLDPGDANRMWLRATYGILISANGGRTWSWLCEPAAGYQYGEDPSMVIGADGTVLVGGLNGLFSTRDHGCNWAEVSALHGRSIVDLTVARDPSTVWALSRLYRPGSGYIFSTWRSDDSGHSFASGGADLPGNLFAETIDVAPSDPSRLYVTAGLLPQSQTDAAAPSNAADAATAGTATGVLLRSANSGVTWDETPIGGLSIGETPFIAAVHPTDPNVLYVRVSGPTVTTGFVQSRLLYTDDAGTTWKEIFRGPADMLGFALSADGSTVMLGLGNSYDPSQLRPVDPSALGIYRASVPAFSFERELQGQVGCLRTTGPDLYVCGLNARGFEVGISHDLGTTATRVLGFGDQISLLACDAKSSVAGACTDQWGYVCSQIAVCQAPRTPKSPAASSGCCGHAGSTTRMDGFSQPSEFAAAISILVASVRRRRRSVRRGRLGQ